MFEKKKIIILFWGKKLIKNLITKLSGIKNLKNRLFIQNPFKNKGMNKVLMDIYILRNINKNGFLILNYLENFKNF